MAVLILFLLSIGAAVIVVVSQGWKKGQPSAGMHKPKSGQQVNDSGGCIPVPPQFVIEQAQLAADHLNESLQLANNSTNPETKVSRLEFARSKLKQLQSMAEKHPALKLTSEAKVVQTIERLTSEFAAAGYYVQTDVSCRSYTSSYAEQAKENSELCKGWRFSATLQMRTPLRVLSMHGKIWLHEQGTPPVVAMDEGAWIPELKNYREMGIDIPDIEYEKFSASEIGPVPLDGGNFLKFLIAVRKIAESETTIESRISELRGELSRDEWQEFIRRLGDKESIYDRFFPDFIDTIPKLNSEILQSLWEMGLTTPAKLTSATDKELLAIRGLGPAKLKLIRQACEEADDKDSEWVDCVNR